VPDTEPGSVAAKDADNRAVASRNHHCETLPIVDVKGA